MEPSTSMVLVQLENQDSPNEQLIGGSAANLSDELGHPLKKDSKKMDVRIDFAKTLKNDNSSFGTRFSVNRFQVSKIEKLECMTLVCFTSCAESPNLAEIINTEFPKLISAHYCKFDNEFELTEAFNHLRMHVRTTFGEEFDIQSQDVKMFIAIIDDQRACGFIFNRRWLLFPTDASISTQQVHLTLKDKFTLWGFSFQGQAKKSLVFMSDKLSHAVGTKEIDSALACLSPAERILEYAIDPKKAFQDQYDESLFVFIIRFGELNPVECPFPLIRNGIRLCGETIFQVFHHELSCPASDGNNQTAKE